MDLPSLFSPSVPLFPPRGHSRTASRSPTRPRPISLLISDPSPSNILEAFTSDSGTLRTSIEGATPAQREFGIRAAIASKKIHEWVAELSSWSWPSNSSEGFEIPGAKRRKLSDLKEESCSNEVQSGFESMDAGSHGEGEFWGCLRARDVLRYESRVEEISNDMEDLEVEEIKTQVLETHILPRSRPPSSFDQHVPSNSVASYTAMDDLTALTTATVLKALPNLARLVRLLDTWSIRLAVLRQVPHFLTALDDGKRALLSGWMTIRPEASKKGLEEHSITPQESRVLSRKTYEIMREVLKDKVAAAGQQLDHMLDILEGHEDTLPDVWLDRMEATEQEYGEWVVVGDSKVREGEWVKDAARLAKKHKLESPAKETDIPQTAGIQDHVQSVSTLPDFTIPSSANIASIQFPLPIDIDNLPPTRIPQPRRMSSLVADKTSALPDIGLSTLDGIDESGGFEPVEHSSILKEDLQDLHIKTDTRGSEYIPLIATSLKPLPNESFQTPSDVEEAPQQHFPTPDTSLAHIAAYSQQLEWNDLAPSPIIQEAGMGLSQDYQYGVEIDHTEYGVEQDYSHDVKADHVGNGGHRDYQHAVEYESSNNDASMIRATARSSFITVIAPEDQRPNRDQPLPINLYLSNSDEPPSKIPFGDYSFQPDIIPQDPPRRVPRFGSGFANSIRKETSLHTSPWPSSSNSFQADLNTPISVKTVEKSQSISIHVSQEPRGSTNLTRTIERPDSTSYHPPQELQAPNRQNFQGISDVNVPIRSPPATGEVSLSHNYLTPNEQDPRPGLNCAPSSDTAISAYSTSEPTPEIHEAEPAAYFASPLAMNLVSRAKHSSSSDLNHSSFVVTSGSPDGEPTISSAAIPEYNMPTSDDVLPSIEEHQHILHESHNIGRRRRVDSEVSGTFSHGRQSSGGSTVVMPRNVVEREASWHEDSPTEIYHITSAESGNSPATPLRFSPPDSETKYSASNTDGKSTLLLPEYDDESPSIGRVNLHGEEDTYSPPSSPLGELHVSKHRSAQFTTKPSLDSKPSYLDNSEIEGEAPLLNNIDISPTPALYSPSKTSDDQLQHQISEILESIPAKIRLRSESDASKFSNIPPAKRSTSLNPSAHPPSRAPTPSFTLAPAYAKNPRPRPQNGNPDIKLYHLSRSTGEAPIKLFVRLVGESGERVMVRVGGGWADLGEYLKEYATHHGRRSDKAGKVEIQDLPPRAVSGSTSISNLRNSIGNNGRSSPSSRPGSALDRPYSSLAVRKTRKSVGEEARERDYRSPSTPLPYGRSGSPAVYQQIETPPSASARSVSSLSWTEEESSLGLAGPRSKKGEISAENAAWVESMKEKVRLASVEKDKFGEINKVGTTKRLFKKGG